MTLCKVPMGVFLGHLSLISDVYEIRGLPQCWKSAEEGNECEKGDDQNENGNIPKGPHHESKCIRIINKSETINSLESPRSSLPSSHFSLCAGLVMVTRRLISS